MWNDIGAIADEPHRNILLLANGVLQDAQRLVESGYHEVAVSGLQPLLDALGIHVNAEKCRPGHCGGQRLSSTHSAHATADDQLAREISAKMLLACGGEGLESSLHDALRADVDPGARGHLAVHHQAGAF